jgi:hypothetical protein
VSDLTTLATLERVFERVRDRCFEEKRWEAWQVMDRLVDEIRAERTAKPPHVAPP